MTFEDGMRPTAITRRCVVPDNAYSDVLYHRTKIPTTKSCLNASTRPYEVSWLVLYPTGHTGAHAAHVHTNLAPQFQTEFTCTWSLSDHLPDRHSTVCRPKFVEKRQNVSLNSAASSRQRQRQVWAETHNNTFD